MKSLFNVIFVFSAAFLAGCGSQNAASNARTATPVIKTGDNAVNTTVNTAANINPVANGDVIPIVPQPANSVNANVNSNGVISPNAGRKITDSPSGKPVVNPTVTAPDDSQFSATMGKDGKVVETRVFRSDRQLAKVVRTWLSVSEKKIEVYLKNGKVITLPGDKLDNISSVPASTILDAVGIKPAAPPPASNRDVNEKRKNQKNQ